MGDARVVTETDHDGDSAGGVKACNAMQKVLGSSELNWLLHRAAQRMGEGMEIAAAQHGITMRGQLVLSSLAVESCRTQLALGASLGLDKTTLTTLLDKLETKGLVVRRPSPTDRRVRVPEITEAGRELQLRVSAAVHEVELEMLSVLDEDDQAVMKGALWRLVTAPGPGHLSDADHPAGSCM